MEAGEKKEGRKGGERDKGGFNAHFLLSFSFSFFHQFGRK